MRYYKFESKSERETKNLASKLAQKILKIKKLPICIALIGELGSGKTTFVRGFLKFFNIKDFIQSPSFLIIKNYQGKTRSQKLTITHIDCYRLNKPKEILYLGFKDILKEKNTIILIEWADKISKLLPKDAIKIYFYHKLKTKRLIKIEIKETFKIKEVV